MFKRFISSQFRKPRGLFGIVTSNWMIKGNWRNYQILLKELNIQPNDKILEIGYGPGIGINLIAEQCNSCIIHGIDFSKLMYKRATERNKKHIDANKVKLFLGDFLELANEPNEYDKIFCINVVYFWKDIRTPFEKIRMLLKEHGMFCMYMAHKDFLKKLNPDDSIFHKYSIEQVVNALKLAGFDKVVNYFDKGYYVKAVK
jgi:ubiquinone/menaquinone biosynthesis C-methylase UbiE